jgi:hypothetical protein
VEEVMAWSLREAFGDEWFNWACNRGETKVSDTKDINSCDFIKSLTAEQKVQLRKLLDEDAKANIPMTVVWGTYIGGVLDYLEEQRNGKRHGKYMEWYKNGNKKIDIDYVDGLKHGKLTEWDEEGRKIREEEYRSNCLVKH